MSNYAEAMMSTTLLSFFFLEGDFIRWTRMLICIIHMEALSQLESSITEKHEWLTAGKNATGGNRLETEVDVRQEKRNREREWMREWLSMRHRYHDWLKHQVTICLRQCCLLRFKKQKRQGKHDCCSRRAVQLSIKLYCSILNLKS